MSPSIVSTQPLDPIPGRSADLESLPTVAGVEYDTPTDGPDGARKRPPRRIIGLVLAVTWIGLIVLLAAFADLLPLRPYDRLVDSLPPSTGPGWRWKEPLGTDMFGRSLTSRLVYGARSSLLVGVVAAVLVFIFGSSVGLTIGYLRGGVDAAANVVLDSVLAFPGLILLLTIASITSRSVWTVIIGLSILGTPGLARVVRAKTLALADRESVIAARAMGATSRRIIFREILPNVLPPLLPVFFLIMASFIIAESSLSFLGLGVPPPAPSWGGMIAEGRQMLQIAPYLVFVPSGVLVLTIMAFRVLGHHIARRFGEAQSRLA